MGEASIPVKVKKKTTKFAEKRQIALPVNMNNMRNAEDADVMNIRHFDFDAIGNFSFFCEAKIHWHFIY